jgi:hypothetical protein
MLASGRVVYVVFLTNRTPCFFGWDSLDFCEPASKEILFLVSVSIRAIRGRLCFLALWAEIL